MGRNGVYDILSTKYTLTVSKKRNYTVESNQLLNCTWGLGSNVLSNPLEYPRPNNLIYPISGQPLYMQTSGALQYITAPSGQFNYIVGMRRPVNGSSESALGVIDLLWANSGIVMTGSGYAQAVNSVEFPPRDDSGLATGYGVYPALLVGATTTQTSQFKDTILEYTNTNNQSFRTGRLNIFPPTAVAGCFLPFSLDIGDLGVKSIQSVTFPRSMVSTTTGSVHLVAFRPIIFGMAPASSYGIDFYSSGLTKIHNDSCLTVVNINGFQIITEYLIEMVIDS